MSSSVVVEVLDAGVVAATRVVGGTVVVCAAVAVVDDETVEVVVGATVVVCATVTVVGGSTVEVEAGGTVVVPNVGGTVDVVPLPPQAVAPSTMAARPHRSRRRITRHPAVRTGRATSTVGASASAHDEGVE